MFCIHKVIGSSPIISSFAHMKKQIKKNINQRYLFNQQEKKRLILKSIMHNLHFSTTIRWKTQKKIFSLSANSSITRIKNRCILTGRSRSVYRFFKLSRIQLRKLASDGSLPGLSKHSW
jgi:small subunit ribosomal protein S14